MGEALAGASALAICTEWREFSEADPEHIIRGLKDPVIVDGRNLFDSARMAELGINYYGIGRGLSGFAFKGVPGAVSAGPRLAGAAG